MRYFNKEGEEISYEQWWTHTLDPKYCTIERHVFGNTDVVTWWIGLQTSCDVHPIIFGTVSRKMELDAPVMIMSHWFSNTVRFDDVINFHINQAAEIGIPLGRKKPAR